MSTRALLFRFIFLTAVVTHTQAPSALAQLETAAVRSTDPRSPFIDEFVSRSGWIGPLYPHGNTSVGRASVSHGVANIQHAPIAQYHSVSLERAYNVEFRENTWVHFRSRMSRALMGANMYTYILLDDQILMQLGINGEQHWQVFQPCVEKSHDTEFFFSSALVNNGQGASDVRTGFADDLSDARYTDWMLFSMKYEATQDERRFRIFVNGKEVVYRSLDAPYPEGVVDMRTPWIPPSGTHRLRFGISTLTDGAEYAATWIPQGVRYRNCYAQYSPSLPRFLSTPPDTTKLPWMLEYDAVMAIALNPEFSPEEVEYHIWQGIYGGTVSLQVAVLTGVIPLPPPEHQQWTFMPPGSYEALLAQLTYLQQNYPPSMPMAKRFVWQSVYAVGGTAVTVHHGYLTPPEVINSPHWSTLSPQEQSYIPALADLVGSSMYWDFLIFVSADNRSALVPQTHELIRAGKLTVLQAISLELLSWQEAQTHCAYILPTEMSAIRAHAKGSPMFCL
ncbi:MAG: hypothetical protein QY326_01255 [Bdellovibrionota bacterium]|nr:MAG: hypothetical protein QY326_01255 [Bdellovibrionota bacterium]